MNVHKHYEIIWKLGQLYMVGSNMKLIQQAYMKNIVENDSEGEG